MSIPGDQPNPYARQPQQPTQPQQPYQPAQQPQQQAPQPGQPAPLPGQAPPQPYAGQPVSAPGPAQPESPYPSYGQQPTTSGYGQGQQQPTGSGAPVGISGLTITGAPPAGSAGPPPDKPRSRIPGWVWGVGGVVLTSAVWAAAVISTDGFANEPNADLAGYHFHEDMCAALDRTALEKHYSSDDELDSSGYKSQHEAIDSSSCTLSFSNQESDYSRTYLYFTTTWHKKTDPAAEFEAKARADEQRNSDDRTYDVEAVDDVGQEAYLVTSTSQRDDSLDSAHLTVRDGWVETRVDWSDGGTRDPDSHTLSKDEVRDMLVASANGTLEKLKTKPSASDDSDGADDSEGSDESEQPDGSTDPGSDTTDPPKRGEGDI